ncbi:cytoplasmic protein nck2 [Plakobranchus ocellatus]|uniref:Cytoplasmic protein nck2 n=1 Tax=Plakobranchus ocellatus TaxID=259542 RepID=A0AAV4DDL4_9GAST|nr:cytoplasmic protein nck2 [Plakobranchus ocellatus]
MERRNPVIMEDPMLPKLGRYIKMTHFSPSPARKPNPASTVMAEGQQQEPTQLVAKYEYRAENSQELTMRKGERLLLVDDSKDWWKVRSPESGKEGFVPSNFVKIAKPKASLFSTILKKHGGKKKSEGGVGGGGSGGRQQGNLSNYPNNSALHNNGDARTNGNNAINAAGGGRVGGFGGTETFQLGQCVPACAKYFYTAQRPDEISLSKGERIMVIERSSDGWWRGRKDDGNVGWFPSNYVEEVTAATGGNSNSDGGGGNLLYYTAAEAKSQSSPSHHSSHHSSSSAGGGSADNFLNTSGGAISIVIALYPFSGKNPGELPSCEKGERLEVLPVPTDSDSSPDWLSVRNSRGECGLVPTSYVSPATLNAALSSGEEGSERGTSSTSSSNPQSQSHSISSVSNNSLSLSLLAGRRQFGVSGPLADHDWYYGKISRVQCEDILGKFAQDGDFLIRDSESTSGHYTVSLKAPGRNKHFRVKNSGGILEIGQQKFSCLEDLIEHYKKHPIFKQESEKLYLVKPFVCPSSPPDN